MPKNRVGKIGYVKLWFQPFNVWLHSYFPKKRKKSAKSNPIFHWKETRDAALILRFLDSPVTEFNLPTFLFSSISAIFREKNGVKVGPNVKTLHVSRFCKNFIFPKFLKNCLCLLEYYLWCKFQQDRAIIGGFRAQKPKKWPNSWMLHRHENIGKFITCEPHMVWRWNLPRFCMTMRPIIWQKF